MTGDPPKPEFVKGFYGSGHLSQNDLVKVIDEINPDKIIPIHTQQPEWFTDHFDNVSHVKNGVPIDLS